MAVFDPDSDGIVVVLAYHRPTSGSLLGKTRHNLIHMRPFIYRYGPGSDSQPDFTFGSATIALLADLPTYVLTPKAVSCGDRNRTIAFLLG